jgi:F-type H+-transporting ATPase subunit epsilon
METLTLSIITPAGIIYQSEVDQVSVMTEMGEITVLPNHIPLVATLRPGELRVLKQEEIIPFSVDVGVIEVDHQGNVVILSDDSQHVYDMDQEIIEQAIERAQVAMSQKEHALDVDFARFQSLIERDINKLQLVRKWRK